MTAEDINSPLRGSARKRIMNRDNPGTTSQASPDGNRQRAFIISDNCHPNKDGYDSLMYWGPLEEYYCGSDFVNYGYWLGHM